MRSLLWLLLLTMMSRVAFCQVRVPTEIRSDQGTQAAAAEPKRASPSVASEEVSKKSTTEQIDASKAVSSPEPHPRLEGNAIYERLLRGTVFICCDLNEDWSSMSFGTGWVLSKERRIVVTNHHVVSGDDGVLPERIVYVHFPILQNGELLTDKWAYAKEHKGIRATIIDTDPSRDLALLVLDEIPDEAEALPLSEMPAHPGDRVHQLGNPGASDAMWVYTSGSVRQVYRAKTILSNGQECEYQRVETQSPTNPGDSGGPVVNDACEIVAIHHATSRAGQLMTYFVDARELKSFLKEAEPWFDPQTAEQFNDRGVHYYEQGRYDKSLEDFSRSLELDPMLADAASNRGWALVQKDDPQTALADFDEAIRINAADSVYWQGRGLAQKALGHHSEAVKDFTQAIRLMPQSAELYNDRADAHYEAKDFALAIRDYSQAIKLAPTVSDYFNSRALCHSALEDYQAAIEDYTAAINLSENAVYLYNRGMAHHSNKDYQAAALDFFQSTRLDPEFAKTHLEHFDRKVVRIRNNTSETIKVSLKYRTKTDKDRFQWYPDGPGEETWATWTFAPGEESFLEHEGFKINADRLRLVAFNEDKSHAWDQFRDQDYVICEEGYDAFVMSVFVITID